MDKNRICYYIYDKKLVDISKNIPNIGNRAVVVQSLVASYNLLQKCKICSCEEATDEDLLSFHSSDYVECLRKAETSSDLEKITDSEEFGDFNLGYDCPLFENIHKFAKLIAGSSLTAAKKLVSNNFLVKRKLEESSVPNIQPKSYLRFKNGVKLSKSKNVFDAPSDFSSEESEDGENEVERRNGNKTYQVEVTQLQSNTFPVCINWFGGWHHAQRDEAGGFCYINDIVISIQYLLKYYKRVLYVDLDIHHGNGVENAFMFSPRVFTFSMHKYEAGFYPASGSLEDIGKGKGRFYAVNVPLKSGITDKKYFDTFNVIFNKIMDKYKADCVVVQCGADCLAGDPLGGFNLTLNAVGECMKVILNQKLPTMVLGGGGYNVPNAARLWAYLTSLIVEHPISNDIPDNSFPTTLLSAFGISLINPFLFSLPAHAAGMTVLSVTLIENKSTKYYYDSPAWEMLVASSQESYNQFLHLYGPEFELSVAAGLRKDENSAEYLESVVATILQNLDKVSDK